MNEKNKNVLYILAAIAVTIFSAISNQWLVWGVIISLMVVESIVSSLRSWTDIRDMRRIDAQKESFSFLADNQKMLLSMQASLTSIEERLSALEKK
jgi:hypothetical protein